MMNKWRDRQRRGAVRPVARSNAALAELPERDHVEVFEEAEYRRQLVGRALELLQGEFRPATWKAFWEHGVSNRSAAEVAAELGVRVGAVYAAKFRVMSRLRQDLQGLLD
jgi:RNA polymerase sigma-70 factor (ECF subfamily)